MKNWQPVDVIVLVIVLIFGFSVVIMWFMDVGDENTDTYADFLGEFFVIIALYIGNKLKK